MQKAIRLRYLLHLRSGISNRHEVAADLHRTHCLLDSLKKILLEDVGFERAARLARNNKQRLRYIDLMLEGFYLRGIGGIEYMQSGEVRKSAESHAQNFGTKAGSAHAEQQHVLETAGLNFLRKLLQLVLLRNLFVDNIKPAQP